MIFIPKHIKEDPIKRWELPDNIFFAAWACHILAFAFLEKYKDMDFKPYWIKPKEWYTWNHIFVSNGKVVFDYKWFTNKYDYINNLESFMKSVFYEWDYEIIEIPKRILISEEESKKYDWLWLREPNQFLHNALPRAEKYLNIFPKYSES